MNVLIPVKKNKRKSLEAIHISNKEISTMSYKIYFNLFVKNLKYSSINIIVVIIFLSQCKRLD